jgi:hypothetical protein
MTELKSLLTVVPICLVAGALAATPARGQPQTGSPENASRVQLRATAPPAASSCVCPCKILVCDDKGGCSIMSC